MWGDSCEHIYLSDNGKLMKSELWSGVQDGLSLILRLRGQRLNEC